MRTNDALRHRVIAACVLLALVIGGVFAVATDVLIESVEHRLIDQRMSRVADRLMEDRRDGILMARSNLLITEFRGGETRLVAAWCAHRLAGGRIEAQQINLIDRDLSLRNPSVLL